MDVKLERKTSRMDDDSKSEKVLEVGAGKDEFNSENEEVIRLDVASYDGLTDVIFDLEDLGKGKQLPFDDASFDKVRAKQVLEHIKCLEAVFEEVYRVLKDGGRFVVEVPHARSPNAFSEMGETGHCQFFNKYTLLHFGENDYGIQNERLDCRFQVEELRVFYNWETGRFPNPFKFWKPESIRAVYLKHDFYVESEITASFWSSLMPVSVKSVFGGLKSRFTPCNRCNGSGEIMISEKPRPLYQRCPDCGGGRL